jgi:hypothetical protein
MLYLSLQAWFDIRPAICSSTYELEVLRNVVHLLALKVGDNNVDVIAPMIVHASQQHKFRQLFMNHE